MGDCGAKLEIATRSRFFIASKYAANVATSVHFDGE